MNNCLEKPYALRICDFDRYGRLLPSSVLDIFQDVATIQASNMGAGRESMLEKGVIWVVVRMKYETLAEPVLHDTVVARTWPHSPSRFSFLRDFDMRDQEGKLLIRASSEWVLVDAQSHEFVSVLDVYDGPTNFLDERSFDAKPRKIRALPPDNAPAFTIVPSFTDVDMNGHVNNSKYANYVLNAIDLGSEDGIKTLQMDYRQEVHEGEALHVRSALLEDGSITAAGVDDAGTTMFASRIELQS